MKRFLFVVILFSLLSALSLAQNYEPTWDSVDKRPTPAWFGDAKFGIFIHWGTYSVPAYAPVLPGKLAYAEWYWNALTNGRSNPKADELQKGTWAFHQKVYGADFPYQNFAPQFKAELFDPDHWADVFARSGAKYVALTSKHHEGFALWPSKEASATWGRPWNAVEIGPKRDVLGDLSDAVRRKGLRMGFYYSLYEWYNPLWLSNKPRYVQEHMFPQFKDLVTHYKPSIIFSDGEWEMSSADWHSPELLAWLFNDSLVKDEVVIDDRWGNDTRHKHGGYWTTGEVPKVEYNKEYSSAYDVTKLIEKPAGGKASIDAFFTTRGNDIYAILPYWSGHSLVIKDLNVAKSVSLLGSSTPFKFKPSKAGLAIDLPDLPEDLRAQPAWVLKITQ